MAGLLVGRLAGLAAPVRLHDLAVALGLVVAVAGGVLRVLLVLHASARVVAVILAVHVLAGHVRRRELGLPAADATAARVDAPAAAAAGAHAHLRRAQPVHLLREAVDQQGETS